MEGPFHAGLHGGRIERLEEDVEKTAFEGAQFSMLILLIFGHQDHRDKFGFRDVVQSAQEGVAVKQGQLQIGDDDMGALRNDQFERFHTVAGGDDPITLPLQR